MGRRLAHLTWFFDGTRPQVAVWLEGGGLAPLVKEGGKADSLEEARDWALAHGGEACYVRFEGDHRVFWFGPEEQPHHGYEYALRPMSESPLLALEQMWKALQERPDLA